MFFETEPFDTLARALALSTVALCWVIFVVRLVGLRSFSKMTAFDFVVTVSVGSLLAGASQATSWTSFSQACLAISVLLGVQYVIARLRQSVDPFETWVQNCPVLLMRDGVILGEALTVTRVAEDDLMAKLREANVHDLAEVHAVVLETTGDISVLHGGGTIEERLLDSVQRVRPGE